MRNLSVQKQNFDQHQVNQTILKFAGLVECEMSALTLEAGLKPQSHFHPHTFEADIVSRAHFVEAGGGALEFEAAIA